MLNSYVKLPEGNYPCWFKHQTWSPLGEIPRQMVTARAFTPLQSSVTRFRFFRVGTCLTLLAAVRNRSRMFAARPWWRPNGKSGHFWRFQTSRNVVSCGRRGTSWQFNSWKCASRNNGAHFFDIRTLQKWSKIDFFGCIVPGRCSNVLSAKILPPGKHTKKCGTSPCSKGKSTINGHVQ